MKRLVALVAVGLALASANPAHADPIIFSGSDPGVGPGGARPNSNAAAAAFDAAAGALGSITLINFEGLSLGNFTTRTVSPGVTVTLGNTAADTDAGITNVLGDAVLGYNTTAGGNQHLRYVPNFGGLTTTATFTFDQPVQAFGAFFTGIGTVAGTISLVFDDGTARTLTLPGSPNGGVQFFGFTDPGALIASVTVREVPGPNVRDIFSIDDVRLVRGQGGVVPEPATLAVFGALAAGAFGLRRRVRAKATA